MDARTAATSAHLANGHTAGDDRDGVSVVIPTYYRNARLREALTSVRGQDYEPVEIVVVDGTEDRYAEPVVEGLSDCIYLSQPDYQPMDVDGVRAVAAARQLGVDHASGRYVRFLDDDDRLRPDAITKQVTVLSAVDGVGMVYCGTAVEDGPERMPSPAVRGEILEHALRLQVGPCIPATMLVSRALLDEIPPMQSLPHDASLVIELARRTAVDFVDEPLVVRGDAERSLRRSLSSVDGRKRTIHEYSRLYDRFPPEVRRTALSRVYLQEGVLTVRTRRWSGRAVRAFALANYYAPEPHGRLVVSLIGSLLGRSGWAVSMSAYSALTDGTHQGETVNAS